MKKAIITALTIAILAISISAVKPEGCKGTFLPGHKQYSNPEVARTWDTYSAQSDGVCVLDRVPEPGKCKFYFELKAETGSSKHLCWYGPPGTREVSVGEMPGFCKGTFLKSHKDYSQLKELWESYSARSEGVCVISRPAIPRKGDCKFQYELAVPEYGVQAVLCWYGEATEPKIIEPKPTPTKPGAPPGCEPVELNDYEEYEEPTVKSLWDSYTADSDDVCAFKGEPEDNAVTPPEEEYPAPVPGCGNGFIDEGEDCENDLQCLDGFCVNCKCYSNREEPEAEPYTYSFETENHEIPCIVSDKPGYLFDFEETEDELILDLIKDQYPEYEIIRQFTADCQDNFMDITFAIPNQYTDVQVLKCSQGSCEMAESSTINEIICGGETLNEIQKENIPKRGLTKIEPIDVEKILTPKEQTIEQNSYKVTLDLTENIKVRMSARAVPQPPNTDAVILGTPIAVQLIDPVDTTITISIPVEPQQNIESYAIAAVDEKGNLKILGGEYDGNAVKVEIPTAELFDNFLREAVFAAIGTYCEACEHSKLETVYDSGSKELVVLLHGFGTDKKTWEPLIADFRLTKAPYNIAAFTHPFKQSVKESANELINLLNSESAKYDKIHIAGHSIGGMVAQLALRTIKEQNSELNNKIQKAILMGVPNDGTPLLTRLNDWTDNFVNKKTFNLLPFSKEALESYSKGINIPTVNYANYYVLAGTQSYDFTKDLFTEPNDGVTTVKGAQHLGDEYLTDRCENFFDMEITHTELTDNKVSRQVVERIIAEEKAKAEPEKAIVGYAQYITASSLCEPNDIFVVIGKRIAEEKTPAPLNCNCGNGYCGIGETPANCPADCAVFYSMQNKCFWIFIIIGLLLLISALLTILRITIGELIIPPIAVLLVTLALLILQSYMCFKFKPFQHIEWWTWGAIMFVALLIEIIGLIKSKEPEIEKPYSEEPTPETKPPLDRFEDYDRIEEMEKGLKEF